MIDFLLVEKRNIDQLIPLVIEYQKFYKVKNISYEKNKDHFNNVLANNDGHIEIVMKNNIAVGFFTIYYCNSTTIAERTAVMNDLYIVKDYRRMGLATKAIKRAKEYTTNYGIKRLTWFTTPDNNNAQALYKKFTERKSIWLNYTLE